MRKPAINGTNPLKAGERFTYGDLKQWPEGERWELIDGIPYAMSPAPRRKHQVVLGELFSQLDAFFRGKECRPHLAPVDVFFPEGDEALDEVDIVVQPDLFVVCDRSKLLDEGIRGAPDFIIEILSPASALKDQSEKRQLYEARGVREYWIINPNSLETFIYILRDGAYDLPTVKTLKAPIPVSIFPELTLVTREADLT